MAFTYYQTMILFLVLTYKTGFFWFLLAVLEHGWCLLYIQNVPIYVNYLSYHLSLNILWASAFLFYWLFNYPLTIWFDWSTFWLAYWLTNWLHHLLTGSLTDRQTDWFYNWLIDKWTDLSDCLHHWLADIDGKMDWPAHWLHDPLAHWQTDWHTDSLTAWSTQWHTDWLTNSLIQWLLYRLTHRQTVSL